MVSVFDVSQTEGKELPNLSVSELTGDVEPVSYTHLDVYKRQYSSYTVEVPYNYYILNVKLETRPITSLAPELLNDEQLEMFRVYMEMSGNKPLIFGGGSPDGSPSEDISGVQLSLIHISELHGRK